MIFNLIILGLVIVIAVRQATQGFFSALITCILAVCCATAALGTYEWLAINWVTPYLDPNLAMAVAVAALFGVPFIVLQLIFNQMVKRASLLPALVEKVGGGICGLITAMVTAGMVAVAVQMIPFDRGVILGFSRVPQPDPENPAEVVDQEVQNNLMLNPDRFAVALGSVLAHGIFSGKQVLHEANPDLLEHVGWVTSAPAPVSRYAKPGSIRVEHTELVPMVYQMTPEDTRLQTPTTYEPLQPMGGTEFWMVRVRLTNEARDSRSSHLFTLRQFRLVGIERGDDVYSQFHPIAIQQEDSSQPINRHIRLVKQGEKFKPVVDIAYSPRDGSDKVEVVFELPSGFEASFLEYKRGARATVKLEDKSTEASATPAAPSSPTAPQPTVASNNNPSSAPPATSGRRSRSSRRSRNPQGAGSGASTSGGNVRTVGASQTESSFGDTLPVALKSYQQTNSDLSGGLLRSGHLVADPGDQASGSDPEIAKFYVPADKRLLQLSVNRLQARSGLGRALSFATATIQNYFVSDDQGNRFPLAGKYARANVNGQDVFEVQYFSEPVGSVGGIGKFNRINESQLKPTDQFVLLFLVDPGATITQFSTGGSATRADDLSAEKLVAPD